jgi:hypothetical protein
VQGTNRHFELVSGPAYRFPSQLCLDFRRSYWRKINPGKRRVLVGVARPLAPVYKEMRDLRKKLVKLSSGPQRIRPSHD